MTANNISKFRLQDVMHFMLMKLFPMSQLDLYPNICASAKCELHSILCWLSINSYLFFPCAFLCYIQFVFIVVHNKCSPLTSFILQLIIETRRRAEVNLAAGDPLLEVEDKEPKQRPLSAPVTQQESHHALITAGETAEYVEKQSSSRPSTCRPRLQEFSSEEESEEGF